MLLASLADIGVLTGNKFIGEMHVETLNIFKRWR